MSGIAILTSDQERMHQRFKYFGAKHLEFRQKCIGLLPQILKEKIYEKKGFDSIFEYAAKLAGLSQEQVKRALSLHLRFEDKPALRALLENGEVGMNKLAKVVSIASTENQALLAAQVKLLPCRALETLARDERLARREDAQAGDGQSGGCSENCSRREDVDSGENCLLSRTKKTPVFTEV